MRGLLPVVLLLVVWQLVGDDSSTSFPPPSTWWTAIKEMNDSDVLLPALEATLKTLFISLIVATVFGAALGAALGASRSLERALTPGIDFLRSVPPPAIVPAAVLLLGISQLMSVITVALAIVWPIVLNAAAARRSIPSVRIEMARTLSLGRLKWFRAVTFPSLIPGIMLGLRVVVSIALVVTLLVEIIASTEGMGRLVFEQQQQFDAASVYGLLTIIAAFGYLLNVGIARLEAFVLRGWPPS